MRLPARAIAWQFGRRHRWGFIALTGYLLVLAINRILFLAPGGRVHFQSDLSFALVVMVPLTATVLYFLGIFSFGLSGDLAARQSMYPARMFTLPVTTGALAGLPMLYGTTAMAVLWFATRILAAWPADFDIPVLWPAVLAASILAWAQALTWMPYPLRGLRVVVTVLWLMVIDIVVMLALDLKASEPVMLAILAPNVPLAYFTARFAVGRARSGEVPDWRLVWRRAPSPAAAEGGRHHTNFASAASAQTWFEWRRLGRSLPAWVAILLPFELALLRVFHETPVIIFEILVGVLLTPPFMAAFVAATVSKSNPDGSDAHSLTPFTATRPLSSVSLIVAKLKATIWSAVAAWMLVIVAIPIGVRLSGTTPTVIDWMHNLVDFAGRPRAIVFVLLILTGLVASTWKQLVQSLYIGMSGREWLVKTSVFVALAFLSVIVPLANWVFHSRFLTAVLWNTLPWILAILVCFKLSAALWIAIRLRDSRLVSDRAILIGAVCWDVVVFALYGLLVWLVPALLFRGYFLALIAILAVPLARLSAAPLALARNRHR
jgi:hypothetical protein